MSQPNDMWDLPAYQRARRAEEEKTPFSRFLDRFTLVAFLVFWGIFAVLCLVNSTGVGGPAR